MLSVFVRFDVKTGKRKKRFFSFLERRKMCGLVSSAPLSCLIAIDQHLEQRLTPSWCNAAPAFENFLWFIIPSCCCNRNEGFDL